MTIAASEMTNREHRMRARIDKLTDERDCYRERAERFALRIKAMRRDQAEMQARINRLEMNLAQALAGRPVRL